jgi:hypothetical protein
MLNDRPHSPPHNLNLSSREAVRITCPSLARTRLLNQTIGLNQEKTAAKGKSGVSGR